MPNVIEILVHATNHTGKAFTEAESGAKSMTATFGKVGMIAGAAMIAIGAEAVKMNAHYENAVTRLETSAGESAKNINLVSNGMLDMASKVGFGANELAKGMYTVESAGYHGADGLTVLKAAAQGAKDENADLGKVANAVTDILLDYHLKASAAADVTSQMVKAVSYGKTNFEAFSASMGSVLPIASALHIKFQDVAGVEAIMTSHGFTAARASMNIANAMRSLANPTAKMYGEMKLLGTSAREVQDMLGTKGLAYTMQFLSEKAKAGAAGLGQTYVGAMRELMGTAPGLAVALMTTGENAKATNEAIDGISKATADAKGNVEGFAAIQQNLAFKMDQAKAAAETLMIRLGQALTPVIDKLADSATTLLDYLSNHIGVLETVGAVVGGVVVVAFLAWAASAAAAAASTIAATWPILAIIAVLAGLAFALKYAWDHSEAFRNIIREIAAVVMPILRTALDQVKEAFKSLTDGTIPWAEILKVVGIALGAVAVVIVTQVITSVVLFVALLRGVIEVTKLLWMAFKASVMLILDFLGLIIVGAAKAFGWVPGLGPKLKAAAEQFKTFRDQVNYMLGGIKDRQVQVTVTAIGNGVNLVQQSTGRVAYQNTHGPTVRAYAHGGIVGAAASGGLRNGLFMAGEHGRELISLGGSASGARVYSNPDTERMLSSGISRGGSTEVRFVGDTPIVNLFLTVIREIVRTHGRGDVQIAFGSN